MAALGRSALAGLEWIDQAALDRYWIALDWQDKLGLQELEWIILTAG